MKTKFNAALYLKDIRRKSEALQSFRCLTKRAVGLDKLNALPRLY